MTKQKKPCGCGKGKVRPSSHPGSINKTLHPRESCMECVEKHLGAAWVLIEEHKNGYPHRLLAIGHLHEAEDESQAWPELHAAIRSARKQYQNTNDMPDFEAMTKILAKLNTNEEPPGIQ